MFLLVLSLFGACQSLEAIQADVLFLDVNFATEIGTATSDAAFKLSFKTYEKLSEDFNLPQTSVSQIEVLADPVNPDNTIVRLSVANAAHASIISEASTSGFCIKMDATALCTYLIEVTEEPEDMQIDDDSDQPRDVERSGGVGGMTQAETIGVFTAIFFIIVFVIVFLVVMRPKDDDRPMDKLAELEFDDSDLPPPSGHTPFASARKQGRPSAAALLPYSYELGSHHENADAMYDNASQKD